MKSTRTHSGFTLLEMAVVVAIVGTMSALTIAGLQAMNKRASFTSAAQTLVGALRRTQAESYGQGATTAFVIDTQTGKYWGIYTSAPFDVSTFNPAAPGNVIISGALPVPASTGAPGSSFGPSGGLGGALPAPFNTIPTATGQTPNLAYCSFCATTGRGAVVFEPGAAVAFSPGQSTVPTIPPFPVGQQFMLTGNYGQGGSRTQVVAIVASTGEIEVFEP